MTVAGTLVCDAVSWSVADRTILQPMSWQLSAGQRLGIIGPNGAGKSSLLKLLAGLMAPTTGAVWFENQPILSMANNARAQQIAFLSQDNHITSQASVWQLVALGRLPHQKWYQSIADVDCELIAAALAHTNLSERALSPLTELSGGELQRAHLARVLVQQAKVLLLDEPTNHLDVQHQHQLLALTRRSHHGGPTGQSLFNQPMTLIASFHDLNVAASYCDQLLLLHQGQLIAMASPAEVLTSEVLEQVYQRRCIVDTNPFDGRPRVTFAPERQ